MAKRGHAEEQILRALRHAEGGTRVADICREHGISEATFYIWKKKYSGLGLSELRELRQLREENSKLKHLVADLSLDRHVLQEIVQKSCKVRRLNSPDLLGTVHDGQLFEDGMPVQETNPKRRAA